jgi:hypothetical protein
MINESQIKEKIESSNQPILESHFKSKEESVELPEKMDTIPKMLKCFICDGKITKLLKISV